MMRLNALPIVVIAALLAGCASTNPSRLAGVPDPTISGDALTPTAPTPAVVADKKPLGTVPNLGNGTSYLRARVAASSGDLDAAAAAYLKAYEAQPNNPELALATFDYQLAIQNYTVAAKLAEQVQAHASAQAHPLVQLTRVVAAVKGHDFVRAEKALKEAAASGLPELLTALLKANVAVAQGKPVAPALAAVRAVPTEDVLTNFAAYQQARLLESAGDKTAALALYQQVHQTQPSHVQSAIRLANLQQIMGDSVAAAGTYGGTMGSLLVPLKLPKLADLKLAPPTPASNVAEVLFGYSSLLLSDEDAPTARQLLGLALWLDPQLLLAQFGLGVLEEQSGRPQAALAAYAAVAATDPAYKQAQVRRVLLHATTDEAAANALLKTLLAQSPNDALLLQTAGDLAQAAGNYKEAIKHYNAAVRQSYETSPGRAQLLFARGAAHERAGNKAMAEADLRDAIRLNPTDASAMNYLAYVWVDAGERLNDALVLLAQALTLDPANPAIIDSVGWAYHQLGEHAKAALLLERALELDPTDAVVNGHLGDVYAALGRTAEAKRQWQRALDLGLTEPRDQARIEAGLKGLQ